MRQPRKVSVFRHIYEIDLLSVIILVGVFGVMIMSGISMYRSFLAGNQAHDAICVLTQDLRLRASADAVDIQKTRDFLQNPTPGLDDPETLKLIRQGLAEDVAASVERNRLVASLQEATDCG